MAFDVVSIVVLTRNRRPLLERCLRSLLCQREPGCEYEVVVVDDGSTDDTRPWVESLARRVPLLRYSYQPHRGVGAARNLGLSLARGQVIAFVADDYELAPDYVKTVQELLRAHPEVGAVRFKVVAASNDWASRGLSLYYTLGVIQRLACASSPGSSWECVRKLASYKEVPTTDHALEPAGAAAFRRWVFDQVGWFDASLRRSEDADLGNRLRAHGIRVLYYPYHGIRHHYERWPREALAKAYATGVFRFHYHRKHHFGPLGFPRGLVQLASRKLAVLVGLLLYAGRQGWIGELAVTAPILASLELANKAGHAVALGRWLLTARASAAEEFSAYRAAAARFPERFGPAQD